MSGVDLTRGVLFATATGLVLLHACAGAEAPAPFAQDAAFASDSRAAELYARYCAACHGTDGSGAPEVSGLFYPRIRAFSGGEFHLVSTDNGVPSDRDLIAVIKNGMPGSAMPPFAWMSDRDLADLARHVRQLAVEGLVPELMSLATIRGEELTEEQARSKAIERTTPGQPIEIGRPAVPTSETLDYGRRLYVQNCAACHGTDGKGLRAFTWPDLIDVQWARDLTKGMLRGGDSHEAIETRIRAGMPGATMPPTNLGAGGTAALVAYVRTLIPEGATDKYIRQRQVIPVRRVDTLPADPESSLWNQHPEVRVALAPMWWREGSVTEAWITALHDGDEIAVRLRWRDESRDDRVLGHLHPDGAALQISDGVNPPIFGMGARDHAVDIWHWKAFSPDDIIGLSDFLGSQAHASGLADVPTYLPAPGVVRPRQRGEAVRVGGVDSIREAMDRGEAILALPSWNDGEWRVHFAHPMGSTGSDIELTPGADIVIALGIWNGGAGDAGGQKSISIWHQLRIDR